MAAADYRLITDATGQRIATALEATNPVIAKVTGTMSSTTGTYVSVNYPTGFDPSNSVIIGHTVQGTSNAWFANNTSVTCVGDATNGIQIKSSDSSHAGKSFAVLLMKLP